MASPRKPKPAPALPADGGVDEEGLPYVQPLPEDRRSVAIICPVCLGEGFTRMLAHRGGGWFVECTACKFRGFFNGPLALERARQWQRVLRLPNLRKAIMAELTGAPPIGARLVPPD